MNQLFETMRLAWLELIYWTRMYMMSVDSGADAKEQYAVEGRLLETADAITDVFAERLPVAVTRQLRNLLVEHVEMTGQIIRTGIRRIMNSRSGSGMLMRIRSQHFLLTRIPTLQEKRRGIFC